MIVATFSDLAQYEALNPRFKKAFDWIQNENLQMLEEGKIELDGDALYASVQKYSTYNPEERFFEAHREYIDIQLLVSGHEKIYYAPLKKLMQAEPYDAAKDFHKLSGIPTQSISLNPGMAVILFPQDGHMPCLWTSGQPEPVTKIVVKVRVA